MGEKNKRGTFVVRINSNADANWRGQITWAEKKETREFQNTLDLIRMMDNALSDVDSLEDVE